MRREANFDWRAKRNCRMETKKEKTVTSKQRNIQFTLLTKEIRKELISEKRFLVPWSTKFSKIINNDQMKLFDFDQIR